MTSKAWKTIHEENGAVAAEGSNCHTSMLCVPSPAAPAGRDAAGTLAFPDHFPKIFRLPQNLLTLAFNATKSQPHNPRIWRRVRRIFAKLAKERKETKEALWKFLRLDEIYKEVIIQPKVQRLRENLAEKEKKRGKFAAKPPPGLNCVAWLLGVAPALRRAPNGAARLAWRVAG
jgi:hypothetical protein